MNPRWMLLKPEQVITDCLTPFKTLDERVRGHLAIAPVHYWSRGLKLKRESGVVPILWERALAPSALLLHEYREARAAAESELQRAAAWLDFVERYRDEIAPAIIQWRIWAYWKLRQMGPDAKLLLLCYERLGAEHGASEATIRCHRRLLRELLLDVALASDAPATPSESEVSNVHAQAEQAQ